MWGWSLMRRLQHLNRVAYTPSKRTAVGSSHRSACVNLRTGGAGKAQWGSGVQPLP